MPKTKDQNAQIKSKRRKDIIKTATYIFATTEYKNVTIDDISKELGCSHGLFYHYYKDKEEVFGAVLENAVTEAKKMFDFQLVNTLPCDKAIILIIEGIINRLKFANDYENSILYLLMNLRLQAVKFEAENKYVNDCLLASNKMYQLIEQTQKENGSNKDPLEITICLFAMLKGLLYNRLYIGQKGFVCPKIETILGLIGIKNE